VQACPKQTHAVSLLVQVQAGAQRQVRKVLLK